jgi:hypothetical protein
MPRAPLRNALTITLIALSLSLLLQLPADARPLRATQTAAPAGWIATWTDWVARLFIGNATPAAPETRQGPGTLRTHAAAGTSTVTPMTGSCVDPNGHPFPCSPL